MKLPVNLRSFRFRLSSVFVFMSAVAIVAFGSRSIYEQAKMRRDAVNIIESDGLILEWKKGADRVGNLDWHPYWETLHSVNNYNSNTHVSANALKALAAFPELYHFNMPSTTLKEEDLHILSRFNHLKSIRLSDNSEITGSTLGDVASLREVIDLDFENTSVRDKDLQFLSKCQRLLALTLNNCHVSDLGIDQIAKMIELEFLSLNGTQITDTGLKEVSKLKELKYLSLDNTSIGDEGAEFLSRSISLETLSLNGTRVSDRGVELLASIPTLKYLCVSRSKAHQAIAHKFKEVSPALIIECNP